MLRYRRYRVFVFFAVAALLAFYHFSGSSEWDASTADAVRQKLGLKNNGAPPQGAPAPITPGSEKQEPLPLEVPAAENPVAKIEPPPVPKVEEPEQQVPPEHHGGKPGDSTPEPATEKGESKEADKLPEHVPQDLPGVDTQDPLIESPDGRKEAPPPLASNSQPRWAKPKEKFPVSPESIIPLPTDAPKKLPKIQHTFEKENGAQKAKRMEQLGSIKEEFLHAWKGYKKHAWGKDELKPLDGGVHNPFNGWGATLVDTLDTLWMMGLKTEFEEAVQTVGKIDFKTSPRSDIPLFETVIRYLGGLVAAHDVSDGKYPVLLEKAVELAEVLIGAFDTPNRMPLVFYHWMPAFASQPHRAPNRVVLAEIGSLSLEFTRLAQLTKEPKYYDAIARITNAFDEWQNNTRLPGLWPINVDTSGCKRPEFHSNTFSTDGNSVVAQLGSDFEPVDENAKLFPFLSSTSEEKKFEEDTKSGKLASPDTLDEEKSTEESKFVKDTDSGRLASPGEPASPSSLGAKTDKTKTSEESKFEKDTKSGKYMGSTNPEDGKSSMEKRQPAGTDKEAADMVDALTSGVTDDEPAEKKEKVSAGKGETPTKTISVTRPHEVEPMGAPAASASLLDYPECKPNGLASTSDYGSEQFTLGSMSDSMYEYLPKQYLLLGGNVDQYRTMYEKAIDVATDKLLFRPMLPNDRDILISGDWYVTGNNGFGNNDGLVATGSHLTCFVGGMYGLGAKLFDRPKDLAIAAKLADGCVWAYEVTGSGIMPEMFETIACEDASNCAWNETKYWEALDPYESSRQQSYQMSMEAYKSELKAYETKVKSMANENTRKVNALSEAAAKANPSSDGAKEDLRERGDGEDEKIEKRQLVDASTGPSAAGAGLEDMITTLGTEHIYKPVEPEPPLSHEEFAKTHIKDNRIPPGMVTMRDKRYILRPEAIESVFYLHRLTGDPHWRASGWRMFQSVIRITRTDIAHAAVSDVTNPESGQVNSMESFWLAETLKYYWLLFSDEEEWSLDEWVFNTEAHPFRRTM
ncbi:glycoside hydrolase family 47 protein [Aulographum hederae CBS 113979]|uniref:alpha-1,2-Mannosidase n=1 Tax=Aulographum hederae CBS 113979 TaxID=1176131 RepID=A0A6G1GMN3_9PEZI|nr:glycoside hydrolase family 47 protein [Aulographum hederae CBS 113979]